MVFIGLELVFIGSGTGTHFHRIGIWTWFFGSGIGFSKNWIGFRIWNWFQRIRIVGLSSDLVMGRIDNHNFSGSGIGFISIGTLVFLLDGFIGLSKGSLHWFF